MTDVMDDDFTDCQPTLSGWRWREFLEPVSVRWPTPDALCRKANGRIHRRLERICWE